MAGRKFRKQKTRRGVFRARSISERAFSQRRVRFTITGGEISFSTSLFVLLYSPARQGDGLWQKVRKLVFV